MMWALLAMVTTGPAEAASPVEEAQLVQVDKLRARMAGEVHLLAFDLLDELVYQWTQRPVFESPTNVVLASVTVPVGLGTGMQALLENHLTSVLLANPTTQVQLVHCPQCSAMFVHSGPEGTVVSRGIDNPELLVELGGATGQHALFVDVEAQGEQLVLRARLTRLTEDLPIVWSHTLTTSTSAPALLRESTELKSAAEVREDYLKALRSRGPIQVPVRLAVRAFARPRSGIGIPVPPLPWLQSGVEFGTDDGRAWTGSLVGGVSFTPQSSTGLMAQARVARLVTGRVRSVTRPDVYVFVGGAVLNVWGPGTFSLQVDPLTVDDILLNAELEDPRHTFGAAHAGIDLRVGNRIGISTFIETIPSLRRSANLDDYVRLFDIGFQSWGNEVTFWF
ncbi:MAG: hypothetical protein KTR31_18465 [Myxococcales bacterium]|nr:hypothetical protein [Myxococcales bacterium]